MSSDRGGKSRFSHILNPPALSMSWLYGIVRDVPACFLLRLRISHSDAGQTTSAPSLVPTSAFLYPAPPMCTRKPNRLSASMGTNSTQVLVLGAMIQFGQI